MPDASTITQARANAALVGFGPAISQLPGRDNRTVSQRLRDVTAECFREDVSIQYRLGLALGALQMAIPVLVDADEARANRRAAAAERKRRQRERDRQRAAAGEGTADA